MTNMKKFGIMSAAIIGLYTAPLSFALDFEDFEASMITVSRGMMNASGDIIHPSEEDASFQKHLAAQDKASVRQGTYGKDLTLNDFEMMDSTGLTPMPASFDGHLKVLDQAYADQEAYNNSWTKYAKDTAVSAAKYTGEKIWDTASYGARTAAAWGLNYHGIEYLEEGLAQGVGGVTGFVFPGSGTGAYYATKGAIKVARYVVPGFEGYLAGTFAPVTKSFVVDPVINYGPAVVKGVAKGTVAAAQMGYAGAKAAANTLSSLYNYYKG